MGDSEGKLSLVASCHAGSCGLFSYRVRLVRLFFSLVNLFFHQISRHLIK